MTGAELDTSPRWSSALEALWAMNRVHCGPEMSAAYRKLSEFYDNVEIFGFASGSKSGSWVAPPEWIVENATLTDPNGRKIADWSENLLSLYSFSPSYTGLVERESLEEHLFSIPNKPKRTPFHFRNQYRHWKPEWGFCIPQETRDSLINGKYEVNIITKFEPGVMEMAEQVHYGMLDDSFLLVGHFDHPQMCNDGLVGCLAGHEAISNLQGSKTHLTYRMLSTVEIVGSVFYAQSRLRPNKIREALFVATSGANAPFAYQKSFLGQSETDRIMRHLFACCDYNATFHDFRRGPLGNDEIAFDVGGVGVPCGSIMRAPFDEYHTDNDTPDTVHSALFEQSVEMISRLINVFESNSYLFRRFEGLPSLSNPELDLYLSPTNMSEVYQDMSNDGILGGLPESVVSYVQVNLDNLNYMMNVLPIMCDGNQTVLDVAEKVQLPFELVDRYTEMWVKKSLLRKEWVHPFRKI
jgi:aminopeptidase-like protein